VVESNARWKLNDAPAPRKNFPNFQTSVRLTPSLVWTAEQYAGLIHGVRVDLVRRHP